MTDEQHQIHFLIKLRHIWKSIKPETPLYKCDKTLNSSNRNIVTLTVTLIDCDTVQTRSFCGK